jgi:16S rRNA (cytosine1402-N4)-methyltransferase
MPDEVISHLNIVPDGTYVDMTLGDGGHSLMIAKKLSAGGRLLAFDKDEEAIKRAGERLKDVSERVTLLNRDFSSVKGVLEELSIKEVDGFIFDLGVSSRQLDEGDRGFSFLKEAPLDMRMDKRNKIDAKKLVNDLPFEDLYRIIKEFGEERFAKRIARKIVTERAKEEIATTTKLAEIISDSIPKKLQQKKINPATKTFQALRIEVNSELTSVMKGVRDAVSLIKKGGRLVVISFHSLEDRIVKKIFREAAKGCTCPKEVIYCQCGKVPRLRLITRKPITPSELEIKRNPRARSAKLRVAEGL